MNARGQQAPVFPYCRDAIIGVFTPDGNAVMLHARTDSLVWFARQLAHQPFDFEILDPPGLRDALSEQAVRLQRLAAKK